MAKKSNTERDKLISDEQGIFQRLMEDHRKVEDLLEQAAAGGNGVDVNDILKQLKLEIMLHTNVEDRIVYSALEESEEMTGDIEHARDEHQEIEALMLDLDGIGAGDSKLAGKLEELRDAIQEHVEEEEQKIFRKAADIMDAAKSRELCRQFDAEVGPERDMLLETEPAFEGEMPEMPTGAERRE